MKKRIAAGLCLLLELSFGAATGWMVSVWLLPYAREQRGYSAVGGEWILILAAGVLGVYLADQFIDQLKEMRLHGKRKVLQVQPAAERPGVHGGRLWADLLQQNIQPAVSFQGKDSIIPVNEQNTGQIEQFKRVSSKR